MGCYNDHVLFVVHVYTIRQIHFVHDMTCVIVWYISFVHDLVQTFIVLIHAPLYLAAGINACTMFRSLCYIFPHRRQSGCQ